MTPPDIDLRRTESEGSARAFWGNLAMQCPKINCLGLWHRSDYHLYEPTPLPMLNDWDELSGPLVIERGDFVKVKDIPLKDPVHGGGATAGIVIGVDVLSNSGMPSMVTLALVGFDSPRDPLPSGSTWCWVQKVPADRLEIVKKRVR